MHPSGAHSTRSQHAFTLAEVMMATVVTLVALVGLIAAVTMGSEMLDVSRKQTIAQQILRNEVENIHLQSWTKVSLLPAGATITVNSNGTSAAGDTQSFALTNYSLVPASYNLSLIGIARDFTLSLTKNSVVDPITHATKANIFALNYTARWTSGNRQKTYVRTSTTYYGKNGLNLYYQK